MQGKQKKWRLIIATSGLLASCLALGSNNLIAQAQTQAIEPAIAPSDVEAAPLTRLAQQQRDTETANTVLTATLVALALLFGIGILMLWSLRKSAIREVVSIMSAQSSELAELENKVHNATRSLNRVLADADEASGELQGRSANFQREITAQRQVLQGLIEDLRSLQAANCSQLGAPARRCQ